ncbi:MAG: NAD(P)H-binding protein [Acidobacteriota bacterium]
MSASDSPRSALVVGSTGLVGGFLVRRLVDDARYGAVHAPTRRDLPFEHPELHPHAVDFDRLGDADDAIFAVDDVFCTLGTTIKKAGSREAFRRVDQHYVEAVARRARAAGARRFTMVSSVGADARSSNFYLGVKGAAEDAVDACAYPELHILRPSLLLGDRPEHRLGERAATVASKLVSPLLLGPVARYRPIHARTVAAGMVGAASGGRGGKHVYTYRGIRRVAGGSS